MLKIVEMQHNVNSLNIVLVNHYAGGLSFGMEFRPYYLAKEWIKKGHKVLIVGASFSHLRNEQPDVKKPIKRETIDGVDYLWLKTNKYSGNGFRRILSMFFFTFRLYWQLSKVLKIFKPNLLIASSTYPLDNFPIKWLALKFKAIYGYEVHDLWPLSPMELGGYSKFHPFIMVMQWAENFAYRNADFVISILPHTLDHMVKHGLKPEKFKHVSNGITFTEWDESQIPEEHIAIIEKIKLDNKIIVGYVGGHAISNALDYLIEAAAIAQSNETNLHFVLVGNGNEKPKLVQNANRLKNVTFLPPVSKKFIPSLLGSMDILYLGWHHNPLYRFGISPNKLMDYMMAAKPIVHSVSAGNDLVMESNCGISVNPENPQEIVAALKLISKMSVLERKQLGRNGKAFVERHHNYEKLAEDFINFAAQKINQIYF